MKRLNKKVGLFCAMAVCVMAAFSTISINAEAATPAAQEGVSTRYTNLSWVYATIDGVEYMRLYNHSTGEWVTDWIPV